LIRAVEVDPRGGEGLRRRGSTGERSRYVTSRDVLSTILK